MLCEYRTLIDQLRVQSCHMLVRVKQKVLIVHKDEDDVRPLVPLRDILSITNSDEKDEGQRRSAIGAHVFRSG